MIRRARFARLHALLLLGLGCVVGLPAGATTIRQFDLFWQSFDASRPDITGTISLDLDALPAALPYDNPTALPPWLVDLVIDVPGSGPYGGRFTRSNYSGLIWNNISDSGPINFDFSTDLYNQGGWGNACPFLPSGLCNFQLLADTSTATPYTPAPFQLYTRQSGAYYLGLKGFAPSSSLPGVPAPLPLAGGVVLLGWSRRLRARISRLP